MSSLASGFQIGVRVRSAVMTGTIRVSSLASGFQIGVVGGGRDGGAGMGLEAVADFCGCGG